MHFIAARCVAVFSIAALLVLPGEEALAIDPIPTATGFGGFVLVAPGVFNVANNMVVEGPPLLGDVGNVRISSLLERPSAQTSAALLFAGEANYTFSSSRTQLFLGNLLEDVIRLDVAFGLGVRQELPDQSLVAASYLFTPLPMYVWTDPYVVDEDRRKTARDKPGFRLRWARILRTGLELTFKTREYRHDQETSGDWLVGQGQLAASDRSLLNRNGRVRVFQGLYRIKPTPNHLFQPMLRYRDDDLDGAAMANNTWTFQLTYLYLTLPLVVDVNMVYTRLEAKATHPVYDRVLDGYRYGAAVSVFYDLFKKPGWRAYSTVEYLKEDANVDFFDSRVSSISFGVIWRYNRK